MRILNVSKNDSIHILKKRKKKHDADKLPVTILGEQWIIFQIHVAD